MAEPENPPSAPEIAELVRRVRRLELAARRNVSGLAGGDYATSVPGRGLLYQEARQYVPGEPVRSIDWNITARLRKPYVKVHHEERQREIFVAVDMSPSMRLGFQRRTKLELAVELAATLAVSAIDAGDRLGHLIFADRVLDRSRPRGGRRQLFRVLRSLLDHAAAPPRATPGSDPRAAIHSIQRHRGRRFVVFLISDFIDHDVPEDLKYVQARHDVSLLHIFDPLEYAAPSPIVFSGYSPEGEARRAPLAPGDTGRHAEMSRFLRERAGPLRIAVGSFSTGDPVTRSLGVYFNHKRRMVVR
jgi:uncharacterized protein (DUF58 family)